MAVPLGWSPSVDRPGYHSAYACSSNFQSMAAKLYDLGVQRNFRGMLTLIESCEELRVRDSARYGGPDAGHAEAIQLMMNLGFFIRDHVIPYERLIAFAHVRYSEPKTFHFTVFDSAGNSETRHISAYGSTGGKIPKKSKSKKTRKSKKKSKNTRKSKRFL